MGSEGINWYGLCLEGFPGGFPDVPIGVDGEGGRWCRGEEGGVRDSPLYVPTLDADSEGSGPNDLLRAFGLDVDVARDGPVGMRAGDHACLDCSRIKLSDHVESVRGFGARSEQTHPEH